MRRQAGWLKLHGRALNNIRGRPRKNEQNLHESRCSSASDESCSPGIEYWPLMFFTVDLTCGQVHDACQYRVGGYAMGHTVAAKEELLKRVRRIAGQVQAIERALTGDADCAKTLHLVAATRGAMNGLLDEIIEDHAWEHVAKAGLTDEERAQGTRELLEAIHRYAK
jgi:DNA-binding FrmR family transcriptional regulator